MSTEKSDDRSLFSPIVLGFLVAGVVAVFALSTLLASLGSGEDTPFGTTVGSPSAIGHKGFYALLERLDLPVARSRADEQPAPGRGGLLVLAEPSWKLISFEDGTPLSEAPNVLIVLPKWWGKADFLHEGWVREVNPIGLDAAQRIVAIIDKKARVVREKQPADWSRNTIGLAPVLTGDVQLMAGSKKLRPLIGTTDKMLLGELVTSDQRIWVLADPDPIENHGIAAPANTRFVLALVDRLRSGTGRIIFDETVHAGKPPERNWIQLLFQFPYIIVTGQILLSLLLLLLATMWRFGGAEVEPPPFERGKMRLIDNIAGLMDRAGHQAVVLRRYVSVKLAEAGRALHAPVGLADGALAGWLDRVATSRGVGRKAAGVVERCDAAVGRRSKTLQGLFAEARDLYRWNKDLLDGSAGRQDHR